MRTKVIIAVVLLSILSISCKNEKSVDQLPVVEEKLPESKVNVTVDMVVPVDDSFQLFYTEDNTLNFSEEKCVRVNVQGKEKSQKIVFELPDDVAFTFMRFDVGENKQQKEMKIENFVIKYYDRKFEAKGNLFFQYFSPNNQLKADNQKSTFVVEEK